MERETCHVPYQRPPVDGGFSLMETLIVIAIVAVLMALAVPTFKFVTQSNRSTAEINGLLSNLQLARAEAIKEGQTVSLCPSLNGTSCSGASNAWQAGWLVFSDSIPLGTVDPTDVIVRVQNAFTGSDTLQTDHNVSVITFSREGFAMNLPNGVTFTLHDSTLNPQYTRCLSLTIVGALSTQTAGVQTAELVPCT